MSLLLDHAVFPHIFDLIVDSADNDSKIALRAVSRDLKRRVDAALFAHLELDQPRKHTFSIRSPHGKLPGPPFPSTTMDLERDLGVWKERLELARVLDVNCDYAAREEWKNRGPVFCGALPGLQVIRRWQQLQTDWHYRITAPTVVDVITRDRYQDTEAHYYGTAWLASRDTVTKQVAHIRYDPCYEDLQCEEFVFVETAPHVVCIFSPVDGPGRRLTALPPVTPGGARQMSGTRRDGAEHSSCVFGSRQVGPLTNPETGRPLPVARSPVHCFVRDLLEFALVGEAERVTFVGLCQMERYLLGVDPSFDDARVENALRVAMRVMAVDAKERWDLEKDLEEADVDKILENVRFLSPGEYRAEVGKAAWEMETGLVPRPRS